MKWLTVGLKIFPLIVGAIHAVESLMTNKKGKDKQDAAVDAIGAMIQAIELSVSKEIMDEKEFADLLRKIIDDYVAIQNFIRDFKKKES